MIKYHLSVNGPNRELLGVQTENEPYHVFVGAAQEAGLDEVLEKLSSGTAGLAKAVGIAQTITAPPSDPWGNPPVPAFQPPSQPNGPAYQQPQQPAAAQPYQQQAPAPRAGGDVKNGHCAHGPATYREGIGKTGKPYKAYFCPAQKGDPNQCNPEFQR